MSNDDIYRQSVQEAVDNMKAGEWLEVDADGLQRAFPADGIRIKNAGIAFLKDQIDAYWGGTTCEFIQERGVYRIEKHEGGS